MRDHYVPEDILREGLELFGLVPARLKEEPRIRRFREKYGCSPEVVAALWDDVDVEDNGASLKHLFWTLHFYKGYPTEADMRSTFRVDPGTSRRWIRCFTKGLHNLCHLKIVLPLPDDRIYYLSVDGTDFRIGEPTMFDRTWYSHKFKKAAVKYEIALTMDGYIAWANGPFRGSEHDLAIFRRDLMTQIPDGKLVIGDKGYRGEPDVLDTPNRLDTDESRSFKSLVLARHETVNKRLKDFRILSSVFRHSNGNPIASHKPIFFAIAVITQYKIEHGEELFELFL